MTDLWGWQDEDARRLLRDGKDELASCWGRSERLVEDTPGLARAAELARRLEEPWWELLFRHWYVQQSLYRGNGSVQELAGEAERLRELARDPRCSGCPQRFCAEESVCNLLSAVDSPGAAAAVLATAERLVGRIDSGVECRGCFELLRVEALLELGRLLEAARALDLFLALTENPNQRCVALLQQARLGEVGGDLVAMGRAVEDCRRLLERETDVNPDNRWGLLVAAVGHRVLAGDLDGAERLAAEEDPGPPEESAEGIRVGIVLARGHAARGAWQAARRHAESAARAALRRGMVRLAAEALLVALRACRELADHEAAEHHAGALSSCLAQLGSRDLDDRACALGVG